MGVRRGSGALSQGSGPSQSMNVGEGSLLSGGHHCPPEERRRHFKEMAPGRWGTGWWADRRPGGGSPWLEPWMSHPFSSVLQSRH